MKDRGTRVLDRLPVDCDSAYASHVSDEKGRFLFVRRSDFPSLERPIQSEGVSFDR